jgi:hypothetical protein
MSEVAANKQFAKWCEYLQIALEEDLPPIAYHYTNGSGVMGILQSKSGVCDG